jgi:hypothetical protein
MALPTHFSVKLLRSPLQTTPLYFSISRVHSNASSVRYQKKVTSDKRLGLDEKDLYRELCNFRLTGGQILVISSLHYNF